MATIPIAKIRFHEPILVSGNPITFYPLPDRHSKDLKVSFDPKTQLFSLADGIKPPVLTYITNVVHFEPEIKKLSRKTNPSTSTKPKLV